MPKRIMLSATLLLAALLVTSACDNALGGSKDPLPTPTPVSSGVPSPAQDVPSDFPTVYVPPIGTVPVFIPPVPSVPDHVEPTPTDAISTAKGDTPEADAIVQKWKEAVRNIHTISGKQEIMRIDLDGTIAPFPETQYSSMLSTDETWVLTDRRNNLSSFRFKAYTRQGYMLAVFDGSADYITWSGMGGEVYRRLPESKTRSDITGDDNLLDSTFLQMLWPAGVTYEMVEKSVINGHSVIELRPVPETNVTNQYTLMRVFLDENNYLPYRYVDEPHKDSAGQQRTVDNLKVNEPVSAADLREGLPDGKDAITIFLQGTNSDPLPTYTSLHDPSLNANFKLFEPAGGIPEGIFTSAIIEMNGVRTPLLSFNKGQGNLSGHIIEGVHLPQVNLNALPFNPSVREPAGSAIDVGGLQGTLTTTIDGVRIRYQRDGTWIQIETPTTDEALKIATSLQPVAPSLNITK